MAEPEMKYQGIPLSNHGVLLSNHGILLCNSSVICLSLGYFLFHALVV